MARPALLPAPSAPLRGRQGTTDEQLMAAYLSGSHAAFGELVHRYAPVLLNIAVRTMPVDDALDLVQQTFLNIHASRLRFRVGARFRPWILTIGLNLLRSYFRRRTGRDAGLPSSLYAIKKLDIPCT